MTRHQTGFTILEVLISTMVFTVILTACIVGITKIGQLYYKGTTLSKIQELTRQLTDEFSQQIQFGSVLPSSDSIVVSSPTSPLIFCVGDNRYRVVPNRELGSSGVDTVIKRMTYSGACDLTDNNFSSATELAVKGMRVLKFSITKTGLEPIWNIEIKLGAGSDDLFQSSVSGSADDPTVYGASVCRSGLSGSEFCGTSELHTTILRRVN